MANSAMDTLRGILGENADEKIKMALNSLSGDAQNIQKNNITDSENSVKLPEISPHNEINTEAMDSILRIREIIENLTTSNSDSRSNLLMSLKPYMRSSRQSSIDTAVRLLNISKLSGIFKSR